MVNMAEIYPNIGSNPTVLFSDPNRANLGLCFSGGGSRALTCAWGQMLGLHTLGLMDKPRYVSSVSGGTWASSIYAFLPENISDAELLGTFFAPRHLSLSPGSGKLDVNRLGRYSLGQAPAGISLTKLSAWSLTFVLFNQRKDYRWLWASIVAQFILEPFGLRFQGDKIWNSRKAFSLSKAYAERHFPEGAPPLDSFVYARRGRPFLIMNDNLIHKVNVSPGRPVNVVQLPNHATPVSAGARGETPDGGIVGGGTVESYGYHATLEQNSAIESPVKVKIQQPNSLIDPVSCSSAFFAEFIAGMTREALRDPARREQILTEIESMNDNFMEKLPSPEGESLQAPDLRRSLEQEPEALQESLDNYLQHFVPTYNYWNLGQSSSNRETQYSDGGTLDNTGILGMLASTDTGGTQSPISLVAFDNTSTPLVKKGDKIIAGGQAAALFGIHFDEETGKYQPFTEEQKDPTSSRFIATSLITVFDNSEVAGVTPFDSLVKGLYASSCGAGPGDSPDDARVNTEAAFHQMELTTVANPLAHVSGGREVRLLYVQNAKILNWQNQIGDPDLKREIAVGQASSDPFATFASFPYYSTFTKIGLENKETNVLAQMWAWAVADQASPLMRVIKSFIED